MKSSKRSIDSTGPTTCAQNRFFASSKRCWKTRMFVCGGAGKAMSFSRACGNGKLISLPPKPPRPAPLPPEAAADELNLETAGQPIILQRMTSKTATANSLSKHDGDYVARIDEC